MENISTSDIGTQRVLGLREKIGAYAELTKPRIALMLVLTSAAGFYLGTVGSFDGVLFANTIIAILLLAFGVATLNQAWAHRTDRLMTHVSKPGHASH